MELNRHFSQSRCKNSVTCQQGNANANCSERTPQTCWSGLIKRPESSVARMWGGGDPHGPSAGIGTGAVAAEHSTEVPPEVKTELPGGPAISLLGTELKEVKSRPGRGTCTPCSLQHASQWPRQKQAARPPWMSKDGVVRMRAAERGSALGRRGSRQPQRCAWTSKALRQVK